LGGQRGAGAVTAGEHGDAVSVQEPITMPAAKQAGVLSERGDGVLDDFAFVDGLWFLVRYVYAIPASEPYAQHDGGHG
jgi:hypothetical protein